MSQAAGSRWKRTFGCAIVLLFAVGLGGCAASVRSVADPQTIVKDPSFDGTWIAYDSDAKPPHGLKLETEAMAVVDSTGNGYRLFLISPEKRRVDAYYVKLFKLGDDVYYDLVEEWMQSGDSSEVEIGDLAVLPLHVFGRIERHDDTITLYALDPEWMDRSLDNGTVKLERLEHEESPEFVDALTGSSDELRSFLRAFGRNTTAFPNSGTFRKVK